MKPTAQRWYRVHAERFLGTIQPRRLAEIDPRDVDQYLAMVGRDASLSAWQFEQVVDAIWNLAQIARVSWVGELDWSVWRASARELDASHPTVAQDYAERPRTQGASAALPVEQQVDGVAGSSLETVRQSQPALFERMVAEIRTRGYSIRTERSYCDWVARFLAFHDGRPAQALDGPDVGRFLESLAVDGRVSASTQNRALKGILLLFRHVLGREEIAFGDCARAKRPKRLPTVLTKGEVARLLGCLEGSLRLMTALAHGSGLRLMEVLRLRVQDIDLGYKQIEVRNGKGGKDRVVPLREALIPELRVHLERVRQQHEQDLADGFGAVYLPDAPARQRPNAPRDWIWQYYFPIGRLSVDPRSKHTRRHDLHESTHVLHRGGQGVRSPLDRWS